LRTFQNIAINKREYLFRDVVYGNFALLEYPKFNIISDKSDYQHPKYLFGPRAIQYYAIKTNEKTYIIDQKKDLQAILQLLEACPDAKSIVDKKSFTLEDLKSVVEKLNNCKEGEPEH